MTSAGFTSGMSEAVEFEAGRQRVGVAAVQKVDGADTIRALEHHREERDVLVYAVFPDRPRLAQSEMPTAGRCLRVPPEAASLMSVTGWFPLRRRASGHRVERLAWKRRAVDRHGCMCAGAPRRRIGRPGSRGRQPVSGVSSGTLARRASRAGCPGDCLRRLWHGNHRFWRDVTNFDIAAGQRKRAPAKRRPGDPAAVGCEARRGAGGRRIGARAAARSVLQADFHAAVAGAAFRRRVGRDRIGLAATRDRQRSVFRPCAFRYAATDSARRFDSARL